MMAMMQIWRMPHHDGATARGPVDLVGMVMAPFTSEKYGLDLSRLAARGRRREAGWWQQRVTNTVSHHRQQHHFDFFCFLDLYARRAFRMLVSDYGVV
jgi:hypothetical protein